MNFFRIGERKYWLIVAALLAQIFCDAEAAQWNFTVLLDHKPIGHHRFERADIGSDQRVVSQAQFSVEWLHIPVFRYRHHDEEVWRDGCLMHIDASTQTNGRSESVRGQREEHGFLVQGPQGKLQAPECIMTFAYWDKRILTQKALLNAQTGIYMPIDVETLPSTTLNVAGHAESAEHYLLKAGDLRIELWYALDGRWLGLAAPTRDGRRMVYRLET